MSNNLKKLTNLLVMAAADNAISAEEIAFILDRGERWGLSAEQIQAALDYAQSVDAELQFSTDRTQQLEMMRELLLMMAADGHLADMEKMLFARAAATLNLSETDVNLLVDSVLHR